MPANKFDTPPGWEAPQPPRAGSLSFAKSEWFDIDAKMVASSTDTRKTLTADSDCRKARPTSLPIGTPSNAARHTGLRLSTFFLGRRRAKAPLVSEPACRRSPAPQPARARSPKHLGLCISLPVASRRLPTSQDDRNCAPRRSAVWIRQIRGLFPATFVTNKLSDSDISPALRRDCRFDATIVRAATSCCRNFWKADLIPCSCPGMRTVPRTCRIPAVACLSTAGDREFRTTDLMRGKQSAKRAKRRGITSGRAR